MVGWIVVLVVVNIYGEVLLGMLLDVVFGELICLIVVFIVFFIGMCLLMVLVVKMLGELVKVIGLGFFDCMLGSIFGVVCGVLLVVVVVLLCGIMVIL